MISTTDTIRALIPELVETLPESVTVTVLTDRTDAIRASVKDVQFELFPAIALVIMVMYLFLRNMAATLIRGGSTALAGRYVRGDVFLRLFRQ